MEQSISYIVQAWNERYEDWGNTAEVSDNVFTLPKVHYDTQAEAEARLAALRAQNPDTKYQLIRVTTTTEVI